MIISHKSSLLLTTLLLRRGFSRSAGKAKRDLYGKILDSSIDILQVDKNADQNQIKKAYYKLAQECHPDKNPGSDSKDKFAQINNAYQILSDSSKRQMYDQTGSTESNPFEGYNQEDIFNQFKGFGGEGAAGMNFEDIFGDIFGTGNTQKGRTRATQGKQNVMANIQLSFTEAVNGIKKSIQYNRKSTCGSCKGSRAQQGTKPEKCNTCQGTGTMTMRQGMIVIRTTCNTCYGEGTKIKNHCSTCSGTGMENKKVTEEIDIPRGIDNNANIRYRGKGNLNGDLIIGIRVKKHPKIRREGNDAHSDAQLSVIDAVLGTKVQVETIYGEKKQVEVPAGTQSGQRIRVPKLGFHVINSSEKGSHVLTIKVKIPKDTTDQEKQLYQKLKAVSSN